MKYLNTKDIYNNFVEKFMVTWYSGTTQFVSETIFQVVYTVCLPIIYVVESIEI